ncbi:family 20 glycosylhydrolase [Prolixibacteraceae bacterium Z1-6]|uniref:beta-N-acetylhexosaminidase n=1 Tax=Draconibacterium aestuarii TaxID=2998507 RepID=A0A9X3F5S4_9BACT|nr:family 20 glycosylhydrolase [Prolixibacteraceae bacterium Z1-6]
MKTGVFLIVILVILSFSSCQQNQVPLVQVIPEPGFIVEKNEKPFVIGEHTDILIPDSVMLPAATFLQSVLKTNLPIIFTNETKQKKSSILFELDTELDSLTNEGYVLDISKSGVIIRSAGPQGLFYAVETIRQMLPAELETMPLEKVILPAVQITDKPRFQWRGMHLDVSRHFMPVEFVKKYIDYLAMHKLNVFHWHLVDGIGWRIEIKSHPELTDIGAWRVVKENKKPWQDFEVWKEGDDRQKYGGYYTQEEIKEVVTYAAEHFITVLPEIELPGHSEVVFQCYPDLVCKDKNNNPLRNTGVYCASNPESYKLLEEIIDEVLCLFPSEYIHIGGDEVNKSNWKVCADCQKLMNEKGYDADDLQSHFVNHFDEYLKSKGRKLIGWHEILEGELSESATIMYWGGINGVADYLKKGHQTVLTTGSHLYFDHYQSLSKHEPVAFGGYSTMQNVYEYEPVPEDLEPEFASLVMGVQGNVWTEYMENPQRVEYMTMPRMAALSEIAWQSKGKKDWEHFRAKMDGLIQHYDQLDINYAKSAFRPNIGFVLNADTKDIEVTIESELETEIYYTIDGTKPTPETAVKYTAPFSLSTSATVNAISVKNGNVMGEVESADAILHKARGAKVTVDPEPTGKYKANGGYTLVDTDFGGTKWGNGKWLGMLSTDFVTTIEFDQPTEISKIGYNCIEETGAGIFFPQELQLSVSNDGEKYVGLQNWRSERDLSAIRTSNSVTRTIEVDFETTSCKYLKIKTIYPRVPNSGVFIFVDEIIVD